MAHSRDSGRSKPVPGAESPSARDALRRLVEEMAGRKLPGERELAERLSISRQRLRVLLDALEVEGTVVRRQGSGTYAAEIREDYFDHVGLLIDQRLKLGDDPFFSLLVERLQLALQSAGVHCFVERIDGGSRPRYMGQGAITVGLAGRRILRHLRAADPPVVGLLDEPLDGPAPHPDRMSLLMVEDRYAGREAGHRIVAAGFGRTVFVGRDDITASRLRRDGLGEVLAANGVELESVACGMNYAAGREIAVRLGEWFKPDGSGTALVAANDWLAVGIRTGLAELGLPEENARIFSFDGLPMAADPTLGIRSLVYPMATMVDDAIAELRRLARHRRGRVIRYTMEWSDGWTRPDSAD